MSGPLGSSQWMYASGDFTIDQSLRFDDDDSAYLTFTAGTPTSARIGTFSVWVKPCGLNGADQSLFGSYTSSSNRAYIRLHTDGNINMYDPHSSSGSINIKTTATYRDPSAWMHILIAIDVTQGTSSNRLKIYVNGEQVTDFSAETYPDNVDQTLFKDGNTYAIGASQDSSFGRYLHGYLAEYNFIDGQQLTPADFGETGTYGEWKPKQYSGTYGNNGFYLPFKADYEVEGFNTVIYKGNGVNGQYIGGTGFQPDLTWIKRRDADMDHMVFDSVRGAGTRLKSSQTEQEEYSSTTLHSFNNDGITVGSGVATGSDGNTFVAWNWDMGARTRDPHTINVEGSGVVHSTTQEKMGDTSIYFPSGNSNYIQIGDAGDIDLGSSNFTFECWIKDGSGYPVSGYAGGHNIYISATEDAVYVNTSGGSNSFDMSATWSNWNHFAIVRVGNVFTVYLNGTATDGTATLTGTVANNAFRLGRNGTDSADGSGYIDELRISNTARYTSNFTPQTTPFGDDVNTLFLLHSDSSNNNTTFIDSSGSGAVANTDGSITSSVKANTTYGQSIVSWTGTGANATVGHGLSSAPEMILLKNRDESQNWGVFHKDLNDGTDSGEYNLYLNLNAGEASGEGFWNDTVPADDVFSVGSATQANGSLDKMIAYCFHSVTGYSSIGSYTGNISTTGPSVTTGFKPAFVMAKKEDAGAAWFMYDNTRSPANTIETALMADNSEDEDYVGTTGKIDFNDNGFQIKASNNDVNADGVKYRYIAFADKREYAYWLDQSGNNNDWTSNNLTESDISVDSPTNNFCTLNPLDVQTDDKLSEGNLFADGTGRCRGTMAVSSGKWYFEVLLLYQHHSTVAMGIREVGGNAIIDNDTDANLVTIQHPIGSGTRWDMVTDGTATNGSEVGTMNNDDIIGIAFNVDDEEISFTRNGSAIHADLTDFDWSGLNNMSQVAPTVVTNGGRHAVANFGQDSSFAGNKTAQGNQDGNEIGDFYYTPPTGYLALCTSNLPDVTVTPSEHFNTVLWTGNDADDRNITGVGFAPNFVWIKSRNTTNDHLLFDSIRGAGNYVRSNASDGTTAIADTLQSFDSDGFQIGTDSRLNSNNDPVVAWNWKANGSGSANNDGDNNATVSANTDAKFSIVSYTGSGGEPKTVAHGLGVSPDFVMIKKINNTGSWVVWHKDLADNYAFEGLDTNGAAVSGGSPISKYVDAVSSTLVTLGDASENNNSGDTFIMYCWASVDGYSSVGSYTGNGDADGTFVYTGFRPAFTLFKKANGSESWRLFHNKVTPYNPNKSVLHPDLSDAESVKNNEVDYLSNGFKLRTSWNGANGDGDTYIFLAFAETPFKNSNAL